MEDVRDISRKIWDALIKEDVEVIRHYAHKEAVFLHMGVTLDRDGEIDYLQKGIIVPQGVDFEEVTVKDFGTTIVVLSKVKTTALVHGKEAVHPFVVTEVYTKDENSIKLASWAYTRITY